MDRLASVGGFSDCLRDYSPSRDENESKQASSLGCTEFADALERGAMIKYDGFIGRVTSAEGGVNHGRIANGRDVVNLEAATADELKTAFEESVKAYRAICKTKGIEPRRRYSGDSQIRMPTEVHERAHLLAIKEEVCLNSLIVDAIQARVAKGRL